MDTIINDEKQIDMSALTFSQLKKRYGTGRSYTISGEGRNRKTGYRNGVMTEIGDIEESLWERLVYRLIVSNNEQHVFERLISYCKAKIFFHRTEAERKQYALELHAARLFENQKWAGYAEFNERSTG